MPTKLCSCSAFSVSRGVTVRGFVGNYVGAERERERERERDRETERYRARQRGKARQRDRERHRHRNRQRDRQRERGFFFCLYSIIVCMLPEASSNLPLSKSISVLWGRKKKEVILHAGVFDQHPHLLFLELFQTMFVVFVSGNIIIYLYITTGCKIVSGSWSSGNICCCL